MSIKLLFSLSLSLILSQLFVNCGNTSSPSKNITSNDPNNNPPSEEPPLQPHTMTIQKITFSPLSLSANEEEVKNIRVSAALTVTYKDKTTKAFPLSYKTLAKVGDTFGAETLGLIRDKNKEAIKKTDGSDYISNDPDGNSLLSVGGKDYLITNMEALPGSIYQTQLTVEESTLKAKNTKSIDLSSLKGTIINCASSKTSYGTHLEGEENFKLNTRYVDKTSPFYIDCEANKESRSCIYEKGIATYLQDASTDYSPYHYGHIVEIAPQVNGTPKSAKHYVTGRFTPELAIMLPDNKTLYMSDDGTYKGLWKFVSDAKIETFKEDWEGTLYAAKLTQKSANNAGDFTLTWIELGKSKDSKIKQIIKDNNPKLSNIFDIKKPNIDGSCTLGFTKVTEDDETECLKLHNDKKKEAAFLESRKYAAYLGATIEFNKAEGLAYNTETKELYLAITAIDKSMIENTQDNNDDIKLVKNQCGAVYTLKLDKNYSAISMNAMVVGKTLESNSSYAKNYTCDPEHIANPDNIKYLGHNTLLIGEDSPLHVNNILWAYHTKDKTLTRIASLPIGAEVTGIDKGIVKNKGILMMNIQHPFEDTPKALDGSKPYSSLLNNATEENKKAIIGYIDGIPEDVLK